MDLQKFYLWNLQNSIIRESFTPWNFPAIQQYAHTYVRTCICAYLCTYIHTSSELTGLPQCMFNVSFYPSTQCTGLPIYGTPYWTTHYIRTYSVGNNGQHSDTVRPFWHFVWPQKSLGQTFCWALPNLQFTYTQCMPTSHLHWECLLNMLSLCIDTHTSTVAHVTYVLLQKYVRAKLKLSDPKRLC